MPASVLFTDDWCSKNQFKCTNSRRKHAFRQRLQIHTAFCSGQCLQRSGLALVNSEEILALCSKSESWRTDTQFYRVFSENISFLLKHSTSTISCTPQDCSLFWRESAPVVCFKSLAWDNSEAVEQLLFSMNTPKSKVSAHHPAFQVLFLLLS